MSVMADENTTIGEQTERIEGLPGIDVRTSDQLDVRGLAPGRYLTVEGEGGLRALELEQEVTRVGRGFYCDLRLEDQSVSRRHAIITGRLNSTRILDDRSSNGTFVNGRRVSDEQLHNGDVIVLGTVVLGYLEVAEQPNHAVSGVKSQQTGI
jgi:pSer/pThr/pTyr-binding forkhead associated (FHA) protein